MTHGDLREAQSHLREGNALRSAGRIADAIEAYRRAVAAAPGGSAGHYNLAIALREAREWREAVLSFRNAAQLSSGMDFDAMQNVVDTLAGCIESGAAPLFSRDEHATPRGARPAVSIVVCSIRPDLLEAMRRNFTGALGDREHEFVVIGDARSLCEGYQRGLERSRHEIVVFSHDDVELLSPRPFEALDRALEGNDIVGLAGSDRVRGPAVMWAGHPHMRGFLAMPVDGDPDAINASTFAFNCGVLGGMQALDGFWFACRRAAALAVGFDAATFDGFHFYDLDFTYRAHLAGLRVAVTTDIVCLHKSHGDFGAEWQRYAARFSAKFPRLDGVHGANPHFGVRLSSRGNALRFYEELRGLAAVP